MIALDWYLHIQQIAVEAVYNSFRASNQFIIVHEDIVYMYLWTFFVLMTFLMMTHTFLRLFLLEATSHIFPIFKMEESLSL